MAETKIFSVAVSQGKAENSSNLMRNVVMKDVERQPVNRPVTLLPSSRAEIQHGGERPEITPSDEEFKPVQRDVEDAPGCVESLDMTDELESVLSQTAETTGEEEVKKTKKNKKKKNNNNSENNVDSSADDFKEVEVKPKKKKNKKQANVEEKEKEPEPSPVVQKEKTPEPELKEKTPENDPAPQPVPRKLKNKLPKSLLGLNRRRRSSKGLKRARPQKVLYLWKVPLLRRLQLRCSRSLAREVLQPRMVSRPTETLSSSRRRSLWSE